MEHFTISRKTMEQAGIFERLKQGDISQREAAERLGYSIRWVRKKLKKYRTKGAPGLQHGNIGRVSKRKIPIAHEQAAIELYKNKLQGVGPTYLSEKLLTLKQIKINEESMRMIMIRHGVWQASQNRPKHRKRRLRRTQLGLMVQLDGSPHDWFEGRAPRCTLLVFIDDATSKLLWLQFATAESTLEAMHATHNYLKTHGRPVEFYVDHGSAWHVNLNNPDHDKLSQWERAMGQLDIKVTHAHSPQAKGRVERANQTLQDRLIPELRLAGINSIEEANKFIKATYLQAHNERFAVAPTDSLDAHRSLDGYNLHTIMTIQEQRIVQADYVVQCAKQFYQIHKHQSLIIRPKDSVTLLFHLDGSLSIQSRGKNLAFNLIEQRPPKVTPEQLVSQKMPYKPAPNHPWRNHKPTLPQAAAVGSIPQRGN